MRRGPQDWHGQGWPCPAPQRVGQVLVMFAEGREKSVDRLPLQVDGRQLVHHVAESRRADQAPGVPGDMLARDAQSGLDTIEKIEIFEVLEQYLREFH
jgi:hypothetical protein